MFYLCPGTTLSARSARSDTNFTARSLSAATVTGADGGSQSGQGPSTGMDESTLTPEWWLKVCGIRTAFVRKDPYSSARLRWCCSRGFALYSEMSSRLSSYSVGPSPHTSDGTDAASSPYLRSPWQGTVEQFPVLREGELQVVLRQQQRKILSPSRLRPPSRLLVFLLIIAFPSASARFYVVRTSKSFADQPVSVRGAGGAESRAPALSAGRGSEK